MLGGHQGVTVQAIETVYNGYRFRSRLEARWAVFFDALNVQYQYEPEGFDLGEAGWYLPDFWLPSGGTDKNGVWVECKPLGTPTSECCKLFALCKASNHDGLFLCGYSYPGEFELFIIWGGELIRVNPIWLDTFIRGPYQGSDSEIQIRKPRLCNAFLLARQARFEHGEHGRPPNTACT